MNTSEAKLFVDHWFQKIEESHSVSELAELLKCPEIFRFFQKDKYPEINYRISPDEINQLKVSGQLSKNGELLPEAVNCYGDPLTKLLYALAWENGLRTNPRSACPQGFRDSSNHRSSGDRKVQKRRDNHCETSAAN